MAIKYYSDGTYTKGDGKLYVPGIGAVGKDGSTTVSKAEGGGGSSNTTSSSSSSKTGSTLTTMRGTGSGSGNSSSKSYTDTLKENITNSVNNPSGGVYNSLSNNSLMKDLQTVYDYAKNNKTDNSIEAYISQAGVDPNERYGQMGNELEYNPYQDQWDNYYKQAYQDLEAKIREQNRLAVEQGTNRLNAQKSNINQAADENARQAYVQYMQSQKALPQQLASQGVSGGATETANLGIQTAYQNNVNAINQNKANRLQEIDNAIVDLQNTGDLTMVEQVLANNQAALDAYTSTFDKGVGYNQWANQYNANRQDTLADQAYRDQVYKDQMAQQELENKWYKESYDDAKKKEETNRVITLLENGIYNPATASALLGVSEDQLQEFVDYIKKVRQLEISNTQSLISNRNSSGGSGSGTEKATSASTINSIINTANKMLNEREDVFGDGSIYRNMYTPEDVVAYILAQNINMQEKMNMVNGLGLGQYMQ